MTARQRNQLNQTRFSHKWIVDDYPEKRVVSKQRKDDKYLCDCALWKYNKGLTRIYGCDHIDKAKKYEKGLKISGVKTIPVEMTANEIKILKVMGVNIDEV